MKRRIRTSISSMFLWDQTPQEMAITVDKAGLEEMEFWVETPWYWEKGRGVDLLEEIKNNLGNLKLTVHAPVMDLNPSSYNDLVHDATIQESLKAIDLAMVLEAEIVTIHPGKRSAKRPVRNAEREKFRRYLEACLERAHEKGVSLALENLEPAPWHMCTTPSEMSSYLEEYSLGMTLDVSHAVPPLSLALSFVEMLADSILNVHVSSTLGNIRHLPPSDGSVDAVLIALRDEGYKGPLTLELDDKKFSRPLSKEDKVWVLRTELQHLESVFA